MSRELFFANSAEDVELLQQRLVRNQQPADHAHLSFAEACWQLEVDIAHQVPRLRFLTPFTYLIRGVQNGTSSSAGCLLWVAPPRIPFSHLHRVTFHFVSAP
jgi:hypothetical protein